MAALRVEARKLEVVFQQLRRSARRWRCGSSDNDLDRWKDLSCGSVPGAGGSTGACVSRCPVFTTRGVRTVSISTMTWGFRDRPLRWVGSSLLRAFRVAFAGGARRRGRSRPTSRPRSASRYPRAPSERLGRAGARARSISTCRGARVSRGLRQVERRHVARRQGELRRRPRDDRSRAGAGLPGARRLRAGNA